MFNFEIVANATQFLTSFMLVRSCFYMVRVRKDFEKVKYWLMMIILIIGTGLTLYNITDQAYVIQRFPFNSIFFFGVAWMFYVITKSKKEDLYSIGNVLKNELSESEKVVVHKINNDHGGDLQTVYASDLDQFKKHVFSITSPGTMLLSLNPPLDSGYDYKFRADMLKGGFFVLQVHPNLYEVIEVDFGSVINKATGRVYVAGERIIIPKGYEHWIVALERSGISAYLKKV